MSTLGVLLDAPAPTTAAPQALRRLGMQTALPLLIGITSFVAWSALAPLDGAAIAPAEVKVELNRKTVMHAEGGIVREILVREGQKVAAGEPLLVVADLRTDTALQLLQDQRRAARLRIARAEAEARLAPQFDVPDDLLADPAAAQQVGRERAVFAMHRRLLAEQSLQLQRQREQADAHARALQTQLASTARSAALTQEELAMNERLAEQGFVHRSRLIALERISADYTARRSEYLGNLAAVQQRRMEIDARLEELRLQAQTQATDELREAGAQLSEVEQRLLPSRDQAERQTVRAPADGTVMALRVAAAGTAVAPREPLLELVPSQEKLVLEARIAPQDIDHVKSGGSADIKLLGREARHAKAMPGRVVVVAPDRSVDAQTQSAWFKAVVEVDAAALKASGAPALQPGMPAEVYVATGSRSLIEYLLAPLRLFGQRALREP